MADAGGGQRRIYVQRRGRGEDRQPLAWRPRNPLPPRAPNSTLAKTYALINQLTSSGTAVSRIATNNDYNRYNFSSNAPAVNNRKFETARVDYNLTEKHHLNFIWNYQVNDRTPDGLNGILGYCRGPARSWDRPTWKGSTASTGPDRAAVGPNSGWLTMRRRWARAGERYRLRYGYNVFRFGGHSHGNPNTYMTNPYNGNYTNYAPRSTPVYQLNDNVSYLKGNHLVNVGFNFTQVNAWQAAANSSLLNTLTLGQATGDPDNTGSTSLFTTATLPGASATQLSDAANLYAFYGPCVGRDDLLGQKPPGPTDRTSRWIATTCANSQRTFKTLGMSLPI